MPGLIGYCTAVLVGFTLGLIGGGGSILSVPILVYLFGIEPVLATAYSLFVVGISSSVGAFNYIRRGLLNYKTAIVFVVPSLIAVFLTRRFLVPAIPEQLFTIGQTDITSDRLFIFLLVIALLGLSLLTLNIAFKGYKKHWRVILLVTPAAIMVFIVRRFIIPLIPHDLIVTGNFTLTKNTAIMTLFAIVMILASFSMTMGRADATEDDDSDTRLKQPASIVFLGVLVGSITGLVGAGGGFMIIPALVIIAGLPIKTAIGTSLLIISVNSLTGFLGDIHNESIHWVFLLSFTGLSVAGIFAGSYISKFIDNKYLKKTFGWFILALGIFIILKELIL
jgi:uncharacterized membrane protein YfcA